MSGAASADQDEQSAIARSKSLENADTSFPGVSYFEKREVDAAFSKHGSGRSPALIAKRMLERSHLWHSPVRTRAQSRSFDSENRVRCPGQRQPCSQTEQSRQ